MAVVIGHHPCFEIATNYFGPHDMWNEHELAATLLNETVELIRCEHSDIVVPAHAEIILECEIKPGATEIEGPFAEFHNYYASEPSPKPRLDLKAITMRKDAIYRHLNATPYTDHQPLAVLPCEARLFDQLQRRAGQNGEAELSGLPDLAATEPVVTDGHADQGRFVRTLGHP